MRQRTVLSLEQALALPSATQRLVQLGFRVIRLEATPVPGRAGPGDPNRYVGPEVAGPDRCAYFFGPNAGKESVALDLKSPRGRELLGRLVRDLPVDVFCCGTLPRRHERLGVDEPTLRSFREDLIWVGLSAFGPELPDTPGYDPALQAMLGYMHLTGPRDGPPTLCGVPVVDLRAGEEVFAQVCLALAERAETGRGARVEVSMARAAASWLLTFLPLLDLGVSPDKLRRNGNEHREFVPVDVYPTADGQVYLAVGNDVQWARLVATPGFESLAAEGRERNAGRRAARSAIHEELARATRSRTTAELVERLGAAGIVAAPIHDLEEVAALPFVSASRPVVELEDGRRVRLAPQAVETEAFAGGEALALPPRYGEHTRSVLAGIGLSEGEIDELFRLGLVAGLA